MSTIVSNLVPTMRLLKIASCLTSSGKATLTYHIGCTTDKDIQFYVLANSSVWLVQLRIVICMNLATCF